MAVPTTRGRKWSKSGDNYNYTTRSGVVLGRVIYDADTRTYKVEKVDSKGQYVLLNHGYNGMEQAAKYLVDNLA